MIPKLVGLRKHMYYYVLEQRNNVTVITFLNLALTSCKDG